MPMLETKCATCGTDTKCMSVCGTFGAMSYACCMRCIGEGREPYANIVDYIAAAGHWPKDINEAFQTEVRRQLKLHGKTEEEFKKDVEKSIAEELKAMSEMAELLESIEPVTVTKTTPESYNKKITTKGESKYEFEDLFS